MNSKLSGHILAIFTVFVWSITYISTKCLLEDFTPVEILIMRFIIGFITLKLIYPKEVKFNPKEEPFYVLAGLTGMCMYFLTENIALTFTTACNVGIILAITPIFTAITTKIFYPKEEKLSVWFFLGFIAALSGIIILSTKGNPLSFNPLGDSLAVLAGVIWSFYSVITKKINSFGYNAIQVTRRSFMYAIIFMIPIGYFLDFNPEYTKIIKPNNLLNLAFLGVGASALCFTSWNAAVKILGTVTTIIYLYATPAFTVIFADIILNEKLTWLGWLGSGIIMVGLVISQKLLPKIYLFATNVLKTKIAR